MQPGHVQLPQVMSATDTSRAHNAHGSCRSDWAALLGALCFNLVTQNSLLLLVLQGDITLEFTWVDSSGDCRWQLATCFPAPLYPPPASNLLNAPLVGL